MTRASISSIVRRLDRLEVGQRRSLGIETFAHVAQEELDQAMKIFEEAFASGNLDDVNSRLATDAPAVLAAGSPAATGIPWNMRR